MPATRHITAAEASEMLVQDDLATAEWQRVRDGKHAEIQAIRDESADLRQRAKAMRLTGGNLIQIASESGVLISAALLGDERAAALEQERAALPAPRGSGVHRLLAEALEAKFAAVVEARKRLIFGAFTRWGLVVDERFIPIVNPNDSLRPLREMLDTFKRGSWYGRLEEAITLLDTDFN